MRSRLAEVNPLGNGTDEANLIFETRLGLTASQRILHSHGEVGPHAQAAVEAVVHERLAGNPLAYALGIAYFAGLSFVVTPAVLIPRPETEFLVQRGRDHLRSLPFGRYSLLDLGCGSGCVGLTLATEFPDLQVTLTDVSAKALDVARENARRLGVSDRCRFLTGDWFDALRRRSRYDVILCNPPYITRQDDPQLESAVAEHEPSLALFLEDDPQEFYFRLGRKAISHLGSKGLFAVEVGYDTVWPARCAFEKLNALIRGHEVHDFSGLERVIWGIRK